MLSIANWYLPINIYYYIPFPNVRQLLCLNIFLRTLKKTTTDCSDPLKLLFKIKPIDFDQAFRSKPHFLQKTPLMTLKSLHVAPNLP